MITAEQPESKKFTYLGGWSFKWFNSIGFSISVKDYDSLNIGMGGTIEIVFLVLTISLTNVFIFKTPEDKKDFKDNYEEWKGSLND